MSTFELATTKIITVREGWGVAVLPTWTETDDGLNSHVSDIEVFVVRIDRDACKLHGNAWCISGPGIDVPVENFQELNDLAQDDTHDLRTRWFETFIEAEAHATYTRERWANPAPWETFVELG